MKVENRDSWKNNGLCKEKKIWESKDEIWKKRDRRTYIEDERFVGRVPRQATPEVYAPKQNHDNSRNCQ